MNSVRHAGDHTPGKSGRVLDGLSRPLRTRAGAVDVEGYEVGKVSATGRTGAFLGATATRYEAVDERHGRPVLLTVVAPLDAADPLGIAQLEREARARVAVHHPNLVPVLDAGTGPDHFFLTVPPVQGRRLDELLRRRAMPMAALLPLLDQVAAALDALRAEGLAHREVTTRNVLVGPRDHVLLGGFDLVDGETWASSGRERRAPRGDLHALALLTTEALAGGRGAPHVTPSVDAVLERGAASRSEGFASAGAFVAALREASGVASIAPPTALGDGDATEDAPAERRRPRRAAIAAVTALVVAGSVGVAAAQRDDGGSSTRNAASTTTAPAAVAATPVAETDDVAAAAAAERAAADAKAARAAKAEREAKAERARAANKRRTAERARSRQRAAARRLSAARAAARARARRAAAARRSTPPAPTRSVTPSAPVQSQPQAPVQQQPQAPVVQKPAPTVRRPAPARPTTPAPSGSFDDSGSFDSTG